MKSIYGKAESMGDYMNGRRADLVAAGTDIVVVEERGSARVQAGWSWSIEMSRWG